MSDVKAYPGHCMVYPAYLAAGLAEYASYLVLPAEKPGVQYLQRQVGTGSVYRFLHCPEGDFLQLEKHIGGDSRFEQYGKVEVLPGRTCPDTSVPCLSRCLTVCGDNRALGVSLVPQGHCPGVGGGYRIMVLDHRADKTCSKKGMEHLFRGEVRNRIQAVALVGNGCDAETPLPQGVYVFPDRRPGYAQPSGYLLPGDEIPALPEIPYRFRCGGIHFDPLPEGEDRALNPGCQPLVTHRFTTCSSPGLSLYCQ